MVLRDLGLEVEDALGATLGVRYVNEAQHPVDVRDVGLADRRVLLFAVVRLVGQAKAALLGVEDVRVGVADVADDVHRGEAGNTLALLTAEHPEELLDR